MNPFELKPQKMDKAFTSWDKVFLKPYDKNEVDPYTRLRVILMSGTEFESVRLSHSFSRMCPNNDVRRRLAYMRRVEQIQQKRVAGLKPADESILEHTIGYEQLAVDLTAALAIGEKNDYVKRQLEFAVVEEFEQLWRDAGRREREGGGGRARGGGGDTEIMPGRPTVAEYRHPSDDVRLYLNGYLNDLRTRLCVNIITAAEQQTMNFYMNVANLYTSPLGRKLYNEIAMIEEQHVTGYGCLKDPSMTEWENLLMNEYTECYLYYSCYESETDARIKKIWGMHFEEEVAHLHEAADLLRTYEGKEWQQCFPTGAAFPELLKFRPQKEFIRGVLKSVRLTGVGEGFEELDSLPDDFRYFAYNRRINGDVGSVGTHTVIEKAIAEFGADYRLQNKEHPVRALSDRKKDNVDLARVKGA